MWGSEKAVIEGNQDALFLHLGQFRTSASATKRASHRVVSFTVGPLTHRFLDDMAGVDLLVLQLLERGENLISSDRPTTRGGDSLAHKRGR